MKRPVLEDRLTPFGSLLFRFAVLRFFVLDFLRRLVAMPVTVD